MLSVDEKMKAVLVPQIFSLNKSFCVCVSLCACVRAFDFN